MKKKSSFVFVDLSKPAAERALGQVPVMLTEDNRFIFAPDVTVEELKNVVLEMGSTLMEMQLVIRRLEGGEGQAPRIISPYANNNGKP